jgi:hypothetical protein
VECFAAFCEAYGVKTSGTFTRFCKCPYSRLTLESRNPTIPDTRFLHVCGTMHYFTRIIRLFLNPKVVRHEGSCYELRNNQEEDARRQGI